LIGVSVDSMIVCSLSTVRCSVSGSPEVAIIFPVGA
jgi:hypothetical protein